jgi:hypothetical protein
MVGDEAILFGRSPCGVARGAAGDQSFPIARSMLSGIKLLLLSNHSDDEVHRCGDGIGLSLSRSVVVRVADCAASPFPVRCASGLRDSTPHIPYQAVEGGIRLME